MNPTDSRRVPAALADRPVVAAPPDADPVVVMGAGPVGLAAAARLVERGIPFLLMASTPWA